MSGVRGGARWRWVVVAAAVAALLSLPVVVAAWPVSAPAITPEQLYARIMGSTSVPYQGYVLSQGTAGLPSLPQLADAIALLNQESHLRVWYAGPQRWRVDEIGIGTERDIYQLVGSQLIWDFGENEVTQVLGDQPARLPRAADLVPPDLTRRLLDATGAGAGTLAALPARRVAGTVAAGVRVTPTDPLSTVGHLDIWAEPRSGLPVQIELTGRGAAAPVLVSRFLDLTLAGPDPAALVPPPIAPDMTSSVTTSSDIVSAFRSLRLGLLPGQLADAARTGNPANRLGIGIYGRGFVQFLVLPVPRRTGLDAMDRAGRAGGLRVAFTEGSGVLVTTSLVSVLVLDSDPAHRTYILVGLVDGSLLRRAGEQLAAYVPEDQ